MKDHRVRKQLSRRFWSFFSWFVLLVVLAGLGWVMNVSKPGTAVTGCWQGCTDGQDSTSERTRILSLNILHGYPEMTRLPQRLDLIVSAIRRYEIDIALLQEVPRSKEHGDSAAYLSAQTGLNYAYLRANGNRPLIGFEEGLVILSRYHLKDVQFAELKPQAAFFEHRMALRAVAETPGGDLGLYVTHLTNKDTVVNQGQAKSLQTFVDQTVTGTAVIAGDFNADDNRDQMKKIGGAWQDSYREIHPVDPGWTCCVADLTNPINTLDNRVDYIFIFPKIEPEVKVVAVDIVLAEPERQEDGWLWASDHAGILLELAWIP